MQARLLLIALIPSYLLSWGKLGHQITAKIAEIHLTEQAKSEIKSVLGNTDLVAISDWADVIRPSKRYIKWHYATIKKDGKLSQEERHGQLYYGIKKSISDYRNKDLPKAKRAEALKLIVHLVGDAHQPLHIGNGLDAGGNLCGVKWFQRRNLVSLHKIWDVFLVKALYAKNPWIVSDTIKLKPDNTEIITWLLESKGQHSNIYPKYCANKKQKQNTSHLSQDYVLKNTPIVRQRLILGGLRLAAILNKPI